ncbi:hypothetical protein TNCT_117351 [Trichonephila clavata]|uniref:DUF4371 domain-containing protein n=1 Tax=Trichonephila clavata TaxID=2740835 RepID=A0A8X6GY92_TRICU|nr:hypothetical protein TNCT_117351 [Trichonephila clavata]
MMNSDVADELSEDITNYNCISLLLDESTDMVDIYQRWISIRMIFKDISVIDIRIINNITSKEENTKCEDVY